MKLTVDRHENWSFGSSPPVFNRRQTMRQTSVVFVVVTLFVASYFLLVQRNFINFHVEFLQLPSKNKTTKNILYWTPMFRQRDFYLGLGSKIFENCTYKNCYATDNRSLVPVEEFDAFLFHAVEYKEHIHGKPGKRTPHQVYIVSDQESPENTPSLASFNNFFNWTMTYRADSDILRSYGHVEKKKIDYQLPTIDEIKRKRKKIAWFVSNCRTKSERHRLYEKLKQFLPIDVYGQCGQLVCSRTKTDDCYKMLERDYKFYLSFENSICDGYVTEKLFNILKLNVVPIVYGGANYKKIAPPNSVINVMDFKSVDSLVKYIKHLDSHPEEYLKLFKWKANYVVNNSNKLALCTLCQKLNEEIQPKVYKNIDEWWFGKNFNRCSGSTFLKKFLQ